MPQLGTALYRLEVQVMTVFNPGSRRGLCMMCISVGCHDNNFLLIEYISNGKGGLMRFIAVPRACIFYKSCIWKTLHRIPTETA